jgi:hypothetical protein
MRNKGIILAGGTQWELRFEYGPEPFALVLGDNITLCSVLERSFASDHSPGGSRDVRSWQEAIPATALATA